MKRSRIGLLFLLSTIAGGPCLAGGTLGTDELKPLMQQQPDVYEALSSSLRLADSAFAETRLGPRFKHLGGARAGPYTIKAALKQSRKEVDVVLCTKVRYLDRDGSELPQGKAEEAARIDEKLSAVMLREPSSSRPECPAAW